jgi:hypothetical protein
MFFPGSNITCFYNHLSTTYWLYLVTKHLPNQLHGAEPLLRRPKMCSYSRISKHFMELEDSLLCSQEPSTGPYPEPDQFSPYHPILRSNLILSTHLRLHLPSNFKSAGDFIQLFSRKEQKCNWDIIKISTIRLAQYKTTGWTTGESGFDFL